MPKTYIVNTNRSNNTANEQEMLTQKKVSAYYTPWKYFIDEIETGDIVFLYGNGQGIIARGIATGVVEVADIGTEEKEEHYMHLDRFEILARPLPPSKITEIAQTATDPKYVLKWNQTMIHLPHFIGLKVWQDITKDCMY